MMPEDQSTGEFLNCIKEMSHYSVNFEEGWDGRRWGTKGDFTLCMFVLSEVLLRNVLHVSNERLRSHFKINYMDRDLMIKPNRAEDL